jgi:exonuclease VII large subunit
VLLQKKQALLAHDPLLPLQKGYSMVTLEDGTLVHDAAQLTVGAKIYLRFAKGQATANIDAIEKDRP